MQTPRLLIARKLPVSVVQAAQARFDVTYRDKAHPMTREEMVSALGTFDAVLPTLGDMFSADVFAEVPRSRCKILANFGVGYNHIDVAAAQAHGLAVTNTPGAVTDATADIALTLMLMTARRAGEGERLVRAGAWEGWHPVQFLGQSITGKALGVVGMGRIGQAIAHRCHYGFGMSVSYVARSAKELPYVAKRYASASEMAGYVDFLVAAVPGGNETHHLIDACVFKAMRRTGYFINIARGEVVDEGALIAALEGRQIAGAGLDVYEFEPHVPDRLKALETVTLLPHLGTAALEVREDMGHLALQNLAAFFDGETPPNLIVPQG